jgi:hypothetical protein
VKTRSGDRARSRTPGLQAYIIVQPCQRRGNCGPMQRRISPPCFAAHLLLTLTDGYEGRLR